jgi:Protein of unknown function (DUF3152)
MGHRGRRRERRRWPFRVVMALAVVGGVVALVPYGEAADVVTRAIDGSDLRLTENPVASRFGGRDQLEAAPDPLPPVDGAPDQESQDSEGQPPEPAPAAKRPPQAARAVELGAPVTGTGRLQVVPVAGTVAARSKVQRYRVEVEGGLPFPAAAFARTVSTVLNDRRSWGRGGAMSFHQVVSGPVDFTVVLGSPTFTDKVCLESGMDTGGRVSCYARNRDAVMLNAVRWGSGAPAYGKDVASYRIYLVNHEVGHALGHGHTRCPGAGRPAPIMVQQTKGVGSCRPNPWPFP